jgi:EpsD family peptidyl-prolyl cis-trans isomerase
LERILKTPFLLLAMLPLAVGVAGCHPKSAKAPSGQVVATVNGREITQRELQVEMAGTTAASAAAQKAEQQAALDRIVRRHILSTAATEQGLDKEPSFEILSERAKDALLIQLLESKVASSVPAPSNEEVTQFIQNNPNIFAERKLLDVDQIRALRPKDPAVITKMEPLKTLDEIAAYLTQNHIPFQRGTNVMDTVGQDPKLVNAVMALPPHEVFIVSSGNEIMINQVRESSVQPFTGPDAVRYASALLRQQHIREAVTRKVERLVAEGRKSVVINKQFGSTRPAAAAPGATARRTL